MVNGSGNGAGIGTGNGPGNTSGNAGTNNHGEQPDPDYIKMFVGQIPRSMDEDQLSDMFQEYGRIHQINVLRDKVTGQSKGKAETTVRSFSFPPPPRVFRSRSLTSSPFLPPSPHSSRSSSPIRFQNNISRSSTFVRPLGFRPPTLVTPPAASSLFVRPTKRSLPSFRNRRYNKTNNNHSNSNSRRFNDAFINLSQRPTSANRNANNVPSYEFSFFSRAPPRARSARSVGSVPSICSSPSVCTVSASYSVPPVCSGPLVYSVRPLCSVSPIYSVPPARPVSPAYSVSPVSPIDTFRPVTYTRFLIPVPCSCCCPPAGGNFNPSTFFRFVVPARQTSPTPPSAPVQPSRQFNFDSNGNNYEFSVCPHGRFSCSRSSF